MKIFNLVLSFMLILVIEAKTKNLVINDIVDHKDLKKLLKTKTNVILLFISNLKDKEIQNVAKVFQEMALEIHGSGTAIQIDCSSEGKKLCKKMKVTPTPYILKHYKDGVFNVDYSRQISVSSMSNFMRDPTGDLPWEEDVTGADVVHLTDITALKKIIQKEKKRFLVMFYTNWCGFCKTLKPEYAKAATELKSKYVMAAIDVNKPENSAARKLYNITGFPTLLCFENGKVKYTFEGENNKDGLVAFMEDPTAQLKQKPKEPDWSADPNSEIVHLTTKNFDANIKDAKSMLIMFYAPWCGHCKKMHPHFEKAAEIMKNDKIDGVLAALDATKENEIGNRFEVRGYPTVKYFSNGEFKFDVNNARETESIIAFMKNPSEPPPPPPPEAAWADETSNVIHLTEETFKPILKKKKHVLVMFYAPWCGHCKKAKPEFNLAAEEFVDDTRIELAAVDCTKFSAVCSVFEVRGYPTIKYFSFLKHVVEYSGGRTAADFIKFLKNPDAPEEEKQPESFGDFPGVEHILILSDKTFEANLKNQNVLVFFYAPWCGFCKKMKKDYAEVAAMLQKAGSPIKVAAFDCTVNRKISEKFGIKSYPTLKYFTSGSFKEDYAGKREAKDMFEFLNSKVEPKKDEL